MISVAIEVWNGSDEEFFALLTKVIFYTGFNRQIVERRWPAFCEVFANFDIDVVASFDELVVEALLKRDSPIIKNARKVRSTVANARICQHLRTDCGSLGKYTGGIIAQRELAGCNQLKKTFHGVGESAAKSLFAHLGGETFRPAW